MNPIDLLFKSRKFLLSLLAVVQTAVFILIPNFPDELWQSIDVLSIFTVEDTNETWDILSPTSERL